MAAWRLHNLYLETINRKGNDKMQSQTGLLADAGATLLTLAPFLLIALATLLVSDWLFSLREKFSLSGEVLKNNTAVGFRRLGLFVGIMIGFSGVLAGDSTGHLTVDLVNTGLYALALIVMMQLALWVNDALVLPGIPNSPAIKDGNVAVAVTELGSMVATGLIAKAAIGGENGGILPVIAFFALGQLALVIMVKLFAALQGRNRLVGEIESGNVAAATVMAAKLWAFGLIVSTAAGGAFTGWAEDVTAFLLTALAGLVFLFVSGFVVDLILVRWHTLRDIVKEKNTASALVYAGGQVGMAYAISTLIL